MAGSFLTHAAVKFSPWDTMAGKSVEFFALTDPRPTVEITNFGAHIVSIEGADRDGDRAMYYPRLRFRLGPASSPRVGSNKVAEQFAISGELYEHHTTEPTL